jgi:Swiss Army Knife, 2H phosphoesterase domain
MSYQMITTSIEQQDILTYARENIPLVGILQQTKGGYIYLKVDDEFIHSLFPLLNVPEKQMPPYFSDLYNQVGAHITVVYQDEQSFPCTMDELGTSFAFALSGLQHAIFEFESYFILSVESPALVTLRRKYGFSDNPVYHGIPVGWHITIAKGTVSMLIS